MNIEIATQLYNDKYRMLFTFEYYIDLLRRGVRLLQANSLGKKCNNIEHKAMNIALEYNIEVMVYNLV
jgi:hypothetical protein